MNLEHVPVFPRPTSIPLDQYNEVLKSHAKESTQYMEELLTRMQLIPFIREQLSWAGRLAVNIEVELLATGSDGRGEKATFVPGRLNGQMHCVPLELKEAEVPSSMNIIAALCFQHGLEERTLQGGRNDALLETERIVAEERDELLQLMTRELMPLGIFEQVEVKSVHATYPSGFLDDQNDSWPSRIFDTFNIMHDGHLASVIRSQYFAELCIQGRGKKLHDREKERANQYKKVCTGTERLGEKLKPGMQHVSKNVGIVTHFDLEEGVVHYDRAHSVASFKYGPLRTVQMYTSTLLIDLLRKYCGHENDGMKIVRGVPHGAPEKLYFLREEGYIKTPVAMINRIMDNYRFFLREYHESEWEFAAHGNTTRVFGSDSFARADAMERMKDIANDVSVLAIRN